MNGELLDTLDANAVVNRLRALYGVETDKALSEAMDIPISTVSSWRTRNRVPYDDCVETVRKFRISFDWLLLGVNPPPSQRDGESRNMLDEADPRLQRMVGFLRDWMSSHREDDKIWLELQLARAVPEYAEWVAGRGRS